MATPSGQQVHNMAFNFYGWAVAIPQHVDGYEVVKLMTRAPSSLPLIKAISDRNLQIRRDLQFTDQEQQTQSNSTTGTEQVLLVGFTVADLPDAAKKSASKKRGTAVGTVVTPDRTIAVDNDNRPLIMVVTPVSGLNGQMKFYGLIDQQDEDGLCTPHVMDQESCFYLSIFRGGIESASVSKVKKQWNKNIRDIAGDEREASPPEVAVSASASANDGDERQVSYEVTESPGDGERQVSPDATVRAGDGGERQVSPVVTPSPRNGEMQVSLAVNTPSPGHPRPDHHSQTQSQTLTAQLMPLLHDVIGIEQTLKEVITAADAAVTSSLEDFERLDVQPLSEDEIRSRSISNLMTKGFGSMYNELVGMTEAKRLRGDKQIVDTIRQIVDTALTPLVSRVREIERQMGVEENADSENADSGDGFVDDIDEINDGPANGTLANSVDLDTNPDGSQSGGEADGWSDASSWSGIHDDEDEEVEHDEDMEDNEDVEHEEMNGYEEVEDHEDAEDDAEMEDEEVEDDEEMSDQEVEDEEMEDDVDLVQTWNESIRSNHSPDQDHDDAASSSISAEGATDVANEINEDGSLCHSVSSPVLGEDIVPIAAMAARVADDDEEEEEDEELGRYWQERARKAQREEAEGGRRRRSLRFLKRGG